MTIPAVFFQPLSDDDRGADRVRVRLGAMWLDRQPEARKLTVLDISVSGFLLETDEPLSEKASLIVELPDGVCKICRVVWSSGRFRGVVFSDPLSETELQRIIVASVETLFDHDQKDEYEPDYGEVHEHEKLPFATRVRIIFGSAAIFWAVIGSLTWSALVAT